MALNADTELRFDDGVLPANSNVLTFFSRVLRNAVEAGDRPLASTDSAESNSSSTIVIPMQGLTKSQWLLAAPFWHPVDPTPTVQSWQEAEELLKIGSRFDLRPVLDKASDFIAANVSQLTATTTSSSATSNGSNDSTDMCVWKWLLLADELRLRSSLPALINRTVEIDRVSCSIPANIQPLSAATLQGLVIALAAVQIKYCKYCERNGRSKRILSQVWRCNNCGCAE